jgi:hypothetical protein
MTEHMTHEQYVASVRRRAAEMAAGILTGSVPVLEGCNALATLRCEVEVEVEVEVEAEAEDHDPDFVSFAAISSEICQ